MNASFFLPTKVHFGQNAIQNNPSELLLGKHAILVTGRHSAKACGALFEITEILTKNGVGYTVFDKITENPPLLTCHEGGKLAASVGADFVIGIGGGSPLDAAKAVACFAANPELLPMEIYDLEKHANPSLPIVAVPTTAGTGSEVNIYSVLSLPDGKTKKTFKSPHSWPKVAFVDPKYADTLPAEVTVSTALDAFAHAMESYLSPKSTVFSEQAALFAAKEIFDVLSEAPAAFTPLMRERLAAAATAGGMAISVTGTGFPHPLGYSITMLDGVAHGRACAAFAQEYISYNERTEQGKARLGAFAAHIGTTTKVLGALLTGLADVRLQFTKEQIEERVALISGAGNYTNSPYVLSIDEMHDIYRKLFGKKR